MSTDKKPKYDELGGVIGKLTKSQMAAVKGGSCNTVNGMIKEGATYCYNGIVVECSGGSVRRAAQQ